MLCDHRFSNLIQLNKLEILTQLYSRLKEIQCVISRCVMELNSY